MSGWTLVKILDHDHCALRFEMHVAPSRGLCHCCISAWVLVHESESMYYADDGYWSSPICLTCIKGSQSEKLPRDWTQAGAVRRSKTVDA